MPPLSSTTARFLVMKGSLNCKMRPTRQIAVLALSIVYFQLVLVHSTVPYGSDRRVDDRLDTFGGRIPDKLVNLQPQPDVQVMLNDQIGYFARRDQAM